MVEILAKDFIETSEGLIFAVVESGLEDGKVLCFLRYIKSDNQWQKVNTEQANQILTDHYPHYLYFSVAKQAHCHALALDQIVKHHQPKLRLQQLIKAVKTDKVETDCQALCSLYQQQGLDLEQAGVTGSILISAQKSSSDIDLVFYSRQVFNQAREITRQLILQGDCAELNNQDWLESYDRRSCDLSFNEYVWHEKRKFNKAIINQRKFDLNLLNNAGHSDEPVAYQKIGPIVLKVEVIDDSKSFDYPAEFIIKHPQISRIVCYTATYTGQAKAGEWVDVSGVIEQRGDSQQRIVVGSDREARGEYIKVINEHAA